MRTQIKVLLMLALIFCSGDHIHSQIRLGRSSKIRIPVDVGWEFRQAGNDAWYSATVPGSVHTDLLKNKLIEDPFYRDNEQKLQWIGKANWEYRTSFKITPQVLKRKNIDLVFDGLDTYAEVFLNEKLVLRADNMFRSWRVEGRSVLKAGDNFLRILFRSPINEVLPAMAKVSYQLPAPNDQGEKTSPYTRKAPYHYGWDWGPRFVTSGIWRPVSLEAWDVGHLSDLHILQKRVTAEVANLSAQVEIVSAIKTNAEITIDNVTNRGLVTKRQVELVPGLNQFDLDFEVAKPSLWWPNGLGSHPRYEFRARLLINGGLADQRSIRTGLRSLELKQESDQWGKSFAFVINGVPVFAKGANWIPADSFPTRVSREHYRWLIKSAADANMNMLRVWGGGIYESDEFYELCDEMGILLWQEFMFACSLYPANPEFLENIRAEARDNVKRLRNHPSIVIWSGNNEIETAWLNWGWRQTLPVTLWDDYQKIFAGVLKDTCEALDPSRPYWPSSPHGGMEDDPNSLKSGDTHSWKVWHSAAPFSDYQKEFPRFMSEYGFQSFPQIESVEAYTLASDRDIQSPVMMVHQRHPRGNQLIREYMLREYPTPKDFDSFLYVSQVLQADGIRIGAEHLRRIMPRNMGSLYWQLDDCWPVASWSSIDYFGRWKALQYYARRFYSNILISPHVDKGTLNFQVVSDVQEPTRALMNVELIDFDGHRLLGRKQDITILPLESKSYLSIPVSELLGNRKATDLMIYCELLSDGKTISSNEYFFESYKNLTLPKPEISFNVVRSRNGYKITLASDKFAKGVYLSAKIDGFFADNYFDLIPGKKVDVQFLTRSALSLNDFREQLRIRSMKDAF